MTAPARLSVAALPSGALLRPDLRVLRRIRSANVAVRAAQALIVLAIGFEALVLAGELGPGAGTSPFRALTIVSLVAILSAVALSYALLRRRIGQLESLSERLDVALKAQQAAEAATNAKARYLANVSHEIRSPLNAIYGYAQLVEQGGDTRPQHAARVIRHCAEHMTSLVESLLDISQLENGVLRVRSEIVNLPEFLEQIVLMMRPAAKAKGLDFVFERPERLPEFVRTDQNRLRQALINLIGNAIKFSDRGAITFRLRYRGQIATFEIADTGPGIAPEDHARIFNPYEQVSGSGESIRAGVGLGLPITKAIVQILGGNLELESEPGQGACFRVTLMLGEPAGALVPDAPHRRIIGHEGPARSILIVDDDADQRGFFEQFLRDCGFEVAAMPDGESAVALCAARRFDLAVLDISLPGISGWETATRIRERMGHDIVIVMASANSHEFHRPAYDRPTHDHFLVKPFRLDEMAEAIGALLKLSWKWEATGGDTRSAASGPATAKLPAAALPYVERLHERIKIGHVRGIEAEIALLAHSAPEHRELVDALYTALDTFDLAAMSRMLEGA